MWLAEKGYDREMGARPMARLIQQELKKPMAELLLFGDLAAAGGKLLVDLKQDKITLKSKPSKRKIKLLDPA
jgi:ATP-dependent Clp protease ATP-binding subunit ClpA